MLAVLGILPIEEIQPKEKSSPTPQYQDSVFIIDTVSSTDSTVLNNYLIHAANIKMPEIKLIMLEETEDLIMPDGSEIVIEIIEDNYSYPIEYPD